MNTIRTDASSTEEPSRLKHTPNHCICCQLNANIKSNNASITHSLSNTQCRMSWHGNHWCRSMTSTGNNHALPITQVATNSTNPVLAWLHPFVSSTLISKQNDDVDQPLICSTLRPDKEWQPRTSLHNLHIICNYTSNGHCSFMTDQS